jgi:hypothetical protein
MKMYVEDNEIHIILDESVMACWGDKKVLVTGVGHSGTNLFSDVIRASGYYNFYKGQEDRVFTLGLTPLLMLNYGAKLACDSSSFIPEGFATVMDKFPGTQVIVTIRHPFDIALSTCYRELPASMGGDAAEEVEVGPFTMAHATHYLKRWNERNFTMLADIINTYGPQGRAMMYSMESLLEEPEVVAKDIARFLEIEYVPEMAEPWKLNRHPRQKQRYKGELDMGQINLYQRWNTIYDGFYSDKKDFVDTLALGLMPTAAAFNYRIELP